MGKNVLELFFPTYYVFHRNFLGFLLGELLCPRDAAFLCRTFATVVILEITCCLLVVLAAPVVPTLRTDMTAKVAVHEECVGIRTPRTTKIALLCTWLWRTKSIAHQWSVFRHSAEGAVVEYIAVLHVLRSACGSYIRVVLILYKASLKPYGRRTEDKVCCATDIAVLEQQVSICYASEESVLMTEKSAAKHMDAVTGSMQCYSLTLAHGVVLHGKVLESDVTTLYLQCPCAERAHRSLSAGDRYVGMIVPCDDGALCVLATKFDVSEPVMHCHLLFIHTFLNEDDLMVSHVGTTHLYGVLHIAELARAVACNEERVRVVILVRCADIQ